MFVFTYTIHPRQSPLYQDFLEMERCHYCYRQKLNIYLGVLNADRSFFHITCLHSLKQLLFTKLHCWSLGCPRSTSPADILFSQTGWCLCCPCKKSIVSYLKKHMKWCFLSLRHFNKAPTSPNFKILPIVFAGRGSWGEGLTYEAQHARKYLRLGLNFRSSYS